TARRTRPAAPLVGRLARGPAANRRRPSATGPSRCRTPMRPPAVHGARSTPAGTKGAGLSGRSLDEGDEIRVERELLRQAQGPGAKAGDVDVAGLERLGDDVGDLRELGTPEAAGGQCGR